MTRWCGTRGAGRSPQRVVGHKFENQWAVSVQCEKWINEKTDVLVPPDSQLGILFAVQEGSCGFPVGCVEGTKYLYFDAQASVLEKMGKNTNSWPEGALEHGKKWRYCLPNTFVLPAPTSYFCFFSLLL